MSKSDANKIVYFDADDPDMQAAFEKARATFRYFWRELTWENRRIIPGLSVSAVKAPFSDAKPGKKPKGEPAVEQMWFSDIWYDGQFVTGRLMNTPQHLKSVKAGDPVRRPLAEISDWMYAIGDDAYGGFTVNLLRSRMGLKERKEYDKMWGLKFGDPAKTRLVPQWDAAKKASPDDEHPMSKHMAAALKKHLKDDPTGPLEPDENGWTTLHSMALAGSAATVKVLLAHGADANAVTGNGLTPLQLARALGWEKVAAMLLKHGAR